jgi:putative ABC transport system permease protein
VEIILSETSLLCLAGVISGILLSYFMRAVVGHVWPSLTILITVKWMLLAALIAMVGGLLGATYPAWLASRKDPVEALAYD